LLERFVSACARLFDLARENCLRHVTSIELDGGVLISTERARHGHFVKIK
jgi:hypothetical protein